VLYTSAHYTQKIMVFNHEVNVFSPLSSLSVISDLFNVHPNTVHCHISDTPKNYSNTDADQLEFLNCLDICDDM